jgi:hypothetical protein
LLEVSTILSVSLTMEKSTAGVEMTRVNVVSETYMTLIERKKQEKNTNSKCLKLSQLKTLKKKFKKLERSRLIQQSPSHLRSKKRKKSLT